MYVYLANIANALKVGLPDTTDNIFIEEICNI